MKRQIELGYLVLELPDPDTITPVLADVVGLVPGAPAGDARTWRDDDRAQRIVVQPGPANDAVAVGFEAVDAGAYDATVARLRALGADVTDGTDDEAARRRVRRLARATSPWGVQVEVALGLAAAATPYSSPLVPGGFLTEGVGFGHVVFATTAFDQSVRFLTDGLGLAQSDWLEMELAPGIDLEVRFFHCNARHHTVALARAPFDLPQCLHHVMFEANSRDDVGAAFDRAWAAELPIPNGLGRHDNDGMFSFYLQTPAGFQIEFGHGARVVGDDWDDDRRYDRISAWGHQPLRPA
jgi:2,3-dihydroxybiphenyl 1,2-dioxygenase